jgi:hypothetical protein
MKKGGREGEWTAIGNPGEPTGTWVFTKDRMPDFVRPVGSVTDTFFSNDTSVK